MPTRRTFLASGLAAAAQPGAVPWYRRAYRWGQTNITENDPPKYDIPFWRNHWKETHTQAVIINAGGIVAYYPSKFPLHHRAEFLNGRDLFGELTEAAHKDGLFVMARMDSNRVAEDFYQAHPSWFAYDKNGKPYRAADKYITCINSPYYDEYLPQVITEIIERSHPDGVTDNSWAGMGRESICYCEYCKNKFRLATGHTLPEAPNWDDEAYRQWIMWSYLRRIEIWELNNKVTRAAGGKDCIWSGMNSGSVTQQARSFRDLREICKRADIMMLDHQRRDDDTGFQQNGDTGKRVHGMLGWDKLAPESMAMYQAGPGYYRLAAKPAPEARMWMIAGIAGGIQPWWHYIAAFHDDRRMHASAKPIMEWCEKHQSLLVKREPVATVGLVWSQRNTDFFGRDNPADMVDAPYTGCMHALVRARIPYLPVHIDDVATTNLKLLILPNIGGMSDKQCAAIRAWVAKGGSLLATGDTSLYNEWGDPRPDYGLADIFGAHRTTETPKLQRPARRGAGESADRFSPDGHTYLRLPKGPRHETLKGFDDTDILPYGGKLVPLKTDPAAQVPLTYVPPFPTYPPETSWMREPVTTIPGLVLTQKGAARVAFLQADIDRRYAKEHLPDHGNLLANIIRWTLANEVPIKVEGPGLLDVHVYRQGTKHIVHLVNLTSAATWRAPLEEFIPVGPIKVTINNRTRTVPSILDHELLVFE